MPVDFPHEISTLDLPRMVTFQYAVPEPEPLRWDMTLPDGQPLRFDMGPEFTWDGHVPARYYQTQTTPPHMPQNLISATLSTTLANELVADIAALRAKQAAFLLALSAEAKSEILKMGTGNMALEALIRAAATESPGELSANFPLAAWDQDRAFAAAYRPPVNAVKKLASDMEDTLLAADSDSWTAANGAYGDLKKGGVGPSIDQARAIMRQRHGRHTPPTP